jgi:hypothetical protein
VLRDSDEWSNLLVIGICAITIECVGVVCVFLFVIKRAPTHFKFEYFQKRWKFLFIKYRPDVYWWGVPYLIRGVLMNLGLVMFVKGARQLFWIYFTMMVYVCGLTYTFPWRIPITNGLDIVGTLGVATVAAVSTWFAEPDRKTLEADVEKLTIVSSFACAVTFLSAAATIYFPAGLNFTSTAFRRHVSDKMDIGKNNLRKACQAVSALDDPSYHKYYNHLPRYDRELLDRATWCVLCEFGVVKSIKRVTTDEVRKLYSSESSLSMKVETDNHQDNSDLAEDEAQAEKLGEQKKVKEEKLLVADAAIQHYAFNQEDFDLPYQITPKAAGWSCALKGLAATKTQLRPSTPRTASPRFAGNSYSPKAPTSAKSVAPYSPSTPTGLSTPSV